MEFRVHVHASFCLGVSVLTDTKKCKFFLLRPVKTRLQINYKHTKNQCALVLFPYIDNLIMPILVLRICCMARAARAENEGHGKCLNPDYEP